MIERKLDNVVDFGTQKAVAARESLLFPPQAALH